MPPLKPLLGTIDLANMTPINSSNIAPWTINLSFHNTLNRYNKLEKPKAVLELEYRNILHSHQIDKLMFTDATKNTEGVGCAVTDKNPIVAIRRLPDNTSAYRAEVFGNQKI